MDSDCLFVLLWGAQTKRTAFHQSNARKPLGRQAQRTENTKLLNSKFVIAEQVKGMKKKMLIVDDDVGCSAKWPFFTVQLLKITRETKPRFEI
jgi:hypothetical protein